MLSPHVSPVLPSMPNAAAPPTAPSWEPCKDRVLSSPSFPACSGPTRSCWGVTQQMWSQLASKFHKISGSELCEEHGENDLNVPVLPVKWGGSGFVPQAVQSPSTLEGRCHRKGGYSHMAILHPGIATQEMLRPGQCGAGRGSASTSTLGVPHASDTLPGKWSGSPARVVCGEEPPTVQTTISNSAL